MSFGPFTRSPESTGSRPVSIRIASVGLSVLALTASVAVSVIGASPASAASSALYAWGANADGQLGNGSTTDSPSPLSVTLPNGVTATDAAAGGDHSLIIGSDGNVYAWGLNNDGQLGNGTTTNSSTPVHVLLPTGITATAISAGMNHSLAIGSDGNIYAWGYNGFGQLGNGTTTTSSIPVLASLPAGVSATAISAGTYFSLALGSNGQVYAFGEGTNGALGDGGVANKKTPNPVSLPAGVTALAISAGMRTGIVIGSDGNAYAWGANAFGQIGNGTAVDSSTPVKVSLPAGVQPLLVAEGAAHTLILGSDGNLYATGDNEDGQLGNGTTTNKKAPVKVSLPAGVSATAIAAGEFHSLALGSNGNLYAWGYNGNGQLGNGTTTNSPTPVEVNLPSAPTAVFSGSSANASLAIGPPAVTPTSTVVGLSASTITYGQSVTVTATVSPSDGGGSVNFRNGANAISNCTSVPLSLVGSSYQAHCSVPSLTPGSYALSSTYSGDTGYAASTSVPAPLTVSPAPLVVTASSQSTTYGTSPTTVSASYAGFVNGDTASTLTTKPTCSTTASANSAVGSYSASCSGAVDSNYSITYQNGSTTVGPAPLTVTASSGTGTYGSAPPNIAATYVGFVDGDTAASLTTQPTCSTPATSSSAVGSYPSSCVGAIDPNYSISYANGVVAIGGAPLVVTASSASTTYGNDVPMVTASYSGFVNGDSVTSLTTEPTCSTTATSSSSVGSYATSCSGAGDPNYSISYQGGTDTVDPAPIAVSASSGMEMYGTSPSAISPIVSGLQNGENAGVLGSALVCVTSATSSSPVGTYSSSCTGAVDPNYAITYVSGTITVTPSPLTITASSGSFTYGGGVPTTTPTVSGLQNGEDIGVLGPLACATTAMDSSPVGTYMSSCVGATDNNYAITYVDGSVGVTAAPLTITGSSDSMAYGGVVPPITPVVSGLVNGDAVSALGDALDCGTAASSSSDVGSFATGCAGAESSNYSITYLPGTVTVDPANLVVTASSPSVPYGAGPGIISPSYSGLVNGDTAASLTTQPTCGTAANASSPVGTYPTSCSGAADPNYSFTYADGTAQVVTAQLTITASSASATYGGSQPAITATISGFVNGDTAASLTTQPTCGTAASTSSPIGSYPTNCSGVVDPNYSFDYVPGSLQVDPAPLTIAATSQAATYGSAPSEVSPTYSGFVNGDTASSLTTQPTCDTAASASSPVGTYPTSCSGAADSNYSISYTNGAVVVGSAVLVVSANSASMTYGSAGPEIVPTYSGFVNGDNAASLTTQPTCSTSASSTSPVGSYASNCSGAVDSNYSIAYVNGAVSVSPAPLTATASSTFMTYGGAVPALSASYAGFVNGDSPTSLTTPSTCDTSATSSSSVGTYPTSCTGAVDSNYTITDVQGSLQVDSASLTISASSPSITYADTVPPIVASYSGFVNGDTAASLSTAPVCSTSANSSSPVGNYPTSCAGATAANYTITYSDGAVTVLPAPLTVTASSSSITYGGASPTVTASYSGFVTGDSATSLTTQPTCSTVVTSVSPIGTYSSSCGGASDANYSITYIAGSEIVGPTALTITASSPSMAYGGALPIVTASYSGLVNDETPASLATDPTCSTSAVSTSPTGTYPTLCSGAIDSNYSIGYVAGDLQVGPAPLVVAASSASMTYGGSAPAVTASYSGFVNSDTAGSLTTEATCSTTATSAIAVGTYPATCAGAADPNYTVTYQAGSTVVGPAPLVVSASSASMTYGGSAPAVTASYSGFVNSDTAGSLTTEATCSTTATSASPVGTYPDTCTGATDPNYTATYVSGVTAIGSATLVITASSASTTYGHSVPSVTASYAGFVNGDHASSLTTAPTCMTSATLASGVGAVATTCSGAVDPNYSIVYVPGTIQVSPAPLTITASSATITYGGSAPAIAASFSGFENGDSSSALGNTLTCSTVASATSNVGSYVSTCSGASDSNYTLNYVSGMVTVTPAALTVTANSQTRAFGAANPTLTATISGYVNGQTLATSGVTGQPVCATTATASSPGGSYPITCSTGSLAASNYKFTFVAGTLTVTFTTVEVCDHIGSVVVTAGESVMIPPGCVQVGPVSVQPGGSLEAQGAIIIGSISFNGGVVLRICSTALAGGLTATLANKPVVFGDGTSSCLGSAIVGSLALSSNTAGVSVQKAIAAGSLSIQSNSGGVTFSNSAWVGAVSVKQNSGGATVTGNGVLGSLTVTGNTGSVVDRPNTVIGSANLQ